MFESPNLTSLLRAWSGGEASALDHVFPDIYAELQRLAKNRLRSQKKGNTLEPTALVNEAYIRLAEASPLLWQNRTHFFAVAAVLMRRILVDHVRTRASGKRGGGAIAVTLSDLAGSSRTATEPDLLDVDAALNELERLHPRQAQIVEMRYFGGMSVEETAASIGISPATVKREWVVARTWMYQRLTRNR